MSDTQRFRLHTNWTNTVQEVHAFALDDLRDGANLDRLRWAFTDPEQLRPRRTRQALTEEAAARFAALAQRLRARGHEAEAVAHFVNRLVFCMFAEDVGLLPGKMFEKMLAQCQADPSDFVTHAGTLFEAMRAGGLVGFERVAWFNGGLFDTADALPLDRADAAELLAAAKLDWSDVDPSILGTLFERGLDPAKRSQLGAHYTDRDKIMQIVGPVIEEPLLAEWAEARAGIGAALAREAEARAERERIRSPAKAGALTRRAEAARAEAEGLHRGFIERLVAFRVLDPACGSGNFLYLALLSLKGIEHRANLEAEALGLPRGFPQVGPESVLGIELNPFAAELARVSVWIGEIRWMRRNGFDAARDPILRPLDTIECRDAVLAPNGGRAEWPTADAVVGNPPFLGNKRMIGELGEAETRALRRAWPEVPGGADLVAYWFAAAWQAMEAGRLDRAGLVATNSIRGGASREAVRPIAEGGRIFEAWSDEPWTVEGAAVRVSMICFDRGEGPARLDGREVARVYADLTAREEAFDLSRAARLRENRGVSFQGPVKVGPFDVPGETARAWLTAPRNPNGQGNADVLFPLVNGSDITRRPTDRWIINFVERSEGNAALFEAPFEHVRHEVKPLRDANRDEQRRRNWWRLGRSGADLLGAVAGIERYIATPRVAKHRLFVWLHAKTLPDARLAIIARDDDTTFGILHSRVHEVWSLALGGWHGVGNDPQYTPSLGFETFPFPDGLTPDRPSSAYADDPRAQAIAEAARALDARREAWPNPPDLVERVPEVVPGYPDRLIPVDDAAAKELKRRTGCRAWRPSRPALTLQGAAASVALDVELEDRRVVHEPVDGGERHGGVWEDAAPLAEGLVGGDQDGSPLVARADELEEHARLGLVLGDVGEVVEDQQVMLVEPVDGGLEGEFAARRLEALDQVGGAREQDAPAVLDQAAADGGGEMALAPAGRAEQQQVGAAIEPAIAGDQRHDLGFRDRRHGLELEGVERLAGRQTGLGEVALDAASGALGDLVLGQGGEEAGGGPALLVGALGEAGPDGLDRGQAQVAEQEAEAGLVDGAGRAHAAPSSAEAAMSAS